MTITFLGVYQGTVVLQLNYGGGLTSKGTAAQLYVPLIPGSRFAVALPPAPAAVAKRASFVVPLVGLTDDLRLQLGPPCDLRVP